MTDKQSDGSEPSEEQEQVQFTPREMVEAVGGLCARGDYEEAELLGVVAVQAIAQAEPVPQRQLAAALSALAGAQLCNGSYEQAADHTTRAADIYRDLADDAVALGVSLHQAAVAQLHLGQLEAALPLLAEAAELLEKAGSEQASQDLCAVLLTMAELSVEADDCEHAEAMYGRVLEMLEGLEPTSEGHAAWLNSMTGKAFLGLGSAATRQQQAEQAKDYLSRASEFFEAAFGVGHPAMVESLEQVLLLYRLVGDEPAAQAVEQELQAARAAMEQRQIGETIDHDEAADESIATEGGEHDFEGREQS